jgi:6-phosphogluconolactonase
VNSFRVNNGRVEVWRDAAELAERAAELMIGISREAVKANGVYTVALSGGSTPKTLYALLTEDTRASRIWWEQTQVFWSDERCVPPSHADSNYRMAREALLDHVPIPESNIHRMHGEDDPDTAAKNYSAELVQQFGSENTRFSLVLLGMGDDGHTASLFPGSAALGDNINLVAATHVKKLRSNRLTLTLRAINQAAQVIFLVSGKSKATTLKRVLEDKSSGANSLPAKLVCPTHGELLWLVDEEAARDLST